MNSIFYTKYKKYKNKYMYLKNMLIGGKWKYYEAIQGTMGVTTIYKNESEKIAVKFFMNDIDKYIDVYTKNHKIIEIMKNHNEILDFLCVPSVIEYTDNKYIINEISNENKRLKYMEFLNEAQIRTDTLYEGYRMYNIDKGFIIDYCGLSINDYNEKFKYSYTDIIINILNNLCKCIETLNNNNLIHFDLHSGNFLINETSYIVKLIDLDLLYNYNINDTIETKQNIINNMFGKIQTVYKSSLMYIYLIIYYTDYILFNMTNMNKSNPLHIIIYEYCMKIINIGDIIKKKY